MMFFDYNNKVLWQVSKWNLELVIYFCKSNIVSAKLSFINYHKYETDKFEYFFINFNIDFILIVT